MLGIDFIFHINNGFFFLVEVDYLVWTKYNHNFLLIFVLLHLKFIHINYINLSGMKIYTNLFRTCYLQF